MVKAVRVRAPVINARSHKASRLFERSGQIYLKVGLVSTKPNGKRKAKSLKARTSVEIRGESAFCEIVWAQSRMSVTIDIDMPLMKSGVPLSF